MLVVMMLMVVMLMVVMLMVVMLVIMMFVIMMHLARVKICHIMIMILMFFIQYHIKITSIQSRLFNTADHNTNTFQTQTVQRFLKYLLIRPKVQQGTDCHIPANTGGSIQNQNLFTHFFTILSLSVVLIFSVKMNQNPL